MRGPAVRRPDLSSIIARRIILYAQQPHHRGSSESPTKAFGEQRDSIPFPQAQIEAADFQSFFRLFPEDLVQDALRGKDVLDFGSGYGGRTVQYKLCGAKR